MKLNGLKLLIILLTLYSFGGIICQVGFASYVSLITMLLCFIVMRKNNIGVKRQLFRPLLFVWVIALLSMLVTGTHYSYYIGAIFHTYLAVIIICTFNCDYTEINKFIYKASWILCYLGVLNLILSTFAPELFHEIHDSYTRTILYVFNYIPSEEHLFQRNQCVFWEPGIYQIVLNLHLYNILIERRESIKRAILPILLIISTFSTTGLLIMVIVILYWMFFFKKIRLDFRMIVVAVLFVALLIPFVYDNVVTKLEGTHGSAALRAYDLYMGIDVIKHSPFCGIGLDPDRYLKQTTMVDLGYYDVTRLDTDRGNTNTFISIAAFLGIPVALLFIWTLYNQSIFREKKIIFLILLLSLMSEPLFGQLFLFVICFSSITVRYGVYTTEVSGLCNDEVRNEE